MRLSLVLLSGLLTAPLAASLAAAEPASAPKSPLSPEESLKWMVLADEGLRVEIAAAEPEVVDPVTVRFDEHGRMWVAEYRDYPNGPTEGAPPLSRIKLLEDTDDDGRFETAHVFADKLPFCNGLQPWNGGVLATMAGKLVFLKDTDGDHKSDVAETWYTGFAEENPQLRLNHPRFGLDNRIYVANGLRGGTAVDATKPGAQPVSLKGHDFRFDPRTRSYDAIAGNGQFGLTFDDYGNRFLCSNRNPLYHVVLEDRYLARNANIAVPAVVYDVAAAGEASRVHSILPQAWTTSILHAGQFTAACGVDIYRGNSLPKEYYGNSFTCEPTGSLVHRETIKPHGATFAGTPASDKQEFLASRDSWFRPVFCEGGPDGALYVCDMYRAVIEHPQFMPAELKNRPDLRHGDDRGRIYRIVTSTFRCADAKPNLAKAPSAELVKLLDHPNNWWRETAQRLIYERQEADIAALEQLAKSGETPSGRVHALWTLHGLAKLSRETLLIALNDADARVREQAVKLAEPQLNDDADLRAAALKQATDADARLRFQTALSLGELKTIDSATLNALVNILERAGDETWTRIAVATAAPNDGARILAAVIERTKPTDAAEAVRRRALLRELASSSARSLDAASAKPIADALRAWQDSDEGQRLTLAVLAGLKAMKGGWAALFDAEQVKDLTAEILAVAGDVQAPKEHRLDALEIMTGFAAASDTGSTDPAAVVALQVVRTDADGELRGKALAFIASRRSADTAAILISLLPKQSPAMRGQIFDALLSRPERVVALLDAMEQGKIKPRELDQTRAQRLLKNAGKDIKARAEKLLASAMPADRTKALEEYSKALALTADAVRGKEVFKKNCATCHKIGDVGIEVGPSIADLRTKTPEQVLLDVIQPNKAIDNNFISYTVVTDDGLQYVGIVVADTPASVTLKMPDGKTVSVLKTEIDEMSSNGVSLMPEGIERNIPLQDMADVISFVKNWRYLDGSVPDAPGAPKAAAN